MSSSSRRRNLLSTDLSGRVAIVTGAAQGIGKAIAEKIAENGATVFIIDVNIDNAELVAKSLREKGLKCSAMKCDVSNYDVVREMISEILRRRNRIDIMVNNAGILRRTKMDDITIDEWNLVMNINVNGVFNCSKAVLPIMKRQRYGKIINISSSAGRSTSTFGGVHYTTSKAAVLGLTRHMARELAPFGINVNAVCPGSIDTPMVRSFASPEEIKRAIEETPLGRLGTPEDVAYLVLFLASDASSYITGASIDINAGILMM